MKPILIVEDDEHIAKMIAATLSIGGYTSEICEDGERAVTLISERDYDPSPYWAFPFVPPSLCFIALRNSERFE